MDSLTAIILAGGLGTRLRAIHPECPKPMVPVSGRPFIEYLVRYLIEQGIARIVISTGYLSEQIEAHFRNVSFQVPIRCVRETAALGTGGALINVLSTMSLEQWVLAANGDSIAAFDLREMMARARAGVDGVILGVETEEAERYGGLSMDADGLLTAFREKDKSDSSALINGGIYLLRRDLMPRETPSRPVSLEEQCIPEWLRLGKRIAVVRGTGPFIDIGTPESLSGAAQFIARSGLFPMLG